MHPVREDRGRASSDALDPRDHHREDPRVERPLRRAAVLGRLEPVAGPLARAGVARRALPRGRLALHQRRQAPVRRVVRRRRARGGPGAPPLRSAPSPGRRRASRRGAARAAGPPQRRRGAAARPPSACAPRSVAWPRWSGRCELAERRAERAEDLLGDARRRARRASERERRARRARERVQVAEREARAPSRSRCSPPTRRRACVPRTTRPRPRSRRDRGAAARARAEARAADAEARADAAERLARGRARASSPGDGAGGRRGDGGRASGRGPRGRGRAPRPRARDAGLRRAAAADPRPSWPRCATPARPGRRSWPTRCARSHRARAAGDRRA